jgi:hypothetical protein
MTTNYLRKIVDDYEIVPLPVVESNINPNGNWPASSDGWYAEWGGTDPPWTQLRTPTVPSSNLTKEEQMRLMLLMAYLFGLPAPSRDLNFDFQTSGGGATSVAEGS